MAHVLHKEPDEIVPLKWYGTVQTDEFLRILVLHALALRFIRGNYAFECVN